MTTKIVGRLLALVAAAALPAATASAKEYLLVFGSNTVPEGLAARVQSAGGSIARDIGAVGIVVARSDDPAFKSKAATIHGIEAVVPNLVVNWLPRETVVMGEAFGNPPASGDDDLYFDLQWGHDAVDAPEAWNAGYRGAGARVAVLDSGIDCSHPELAPNLNTALSTSFVPGEQVCVQPGYYFNHGTHVAGTIAAADDAGGVIGVAPEAEIIAVKVLSEVTGSGAFAWIIQGIVYAADTGADVINMSLGAYVKKSGFWDDNGTPDPDDDVFVTAREVAQLKNAVGRATTYAHQKGATVITSAGNDAVDFDQTANWIALPSDTPHVLSISATAPVGWALGGNAFLDNPASYTNFGQSAIAFAAPGGDLIYPGNELCTVVLTRPCWVFDLVFSTIPGGWAWAAGTSVAAPHASGVAAIIIGKNGGSLPPPAVEAELRKAADDLGKPGNDDYYGAGRVNAANAVQ